MRTIKCVAVIYQGKTYSLPPPNRHHNVLRVIYDSNGNQPIHENEQGFLDNEDIFMDRKEAQEIALASGQVLDVDKLIGPNLYSEDLW